MEWSIDVGGDSPNEVGGLVLRILQDRYMARIEDYDISSDGLVSVSVSLPDDPWTRRTVLHRARVDQNEMLAERARRLADTAAEQTNQVGPSSDP